MEPNAVPENDVEAAGEGAPNVELPEVAPKGLEVEPSPTPNPGVELNGELAVAETVDVVPKVAFSPPPNIDVLDIGAVVADDIDDPLDTAAVEPKGDLLSNPPKGELDAPTEAAMFPKPNDVFADDGGVVFASNGLDVLYLFASLANISGSFPYF